MSDKPPIQKPPVRMPGGPNVPPPPPPQPIYHPAPIVQHVPVYVPVGPAYEPPVPSAPMTSFVSVLGWVSVIWAVGMVVLGFILRSTSADGSSESVANVSMWLSVVLIPLGMIGGLFALFEIGREVPADAPKPTALRLLLAAAMLCGGVGGQFWFSSYLTNSAAASLVSKLNGNWERVSTVTTPHNSAVQMKSSKSWTDSNPGSESDPPRDIHLEFTSSTITVVMSDGTRQSSLSYQATGANSFRRFGSSTDEIVVEFLPSGEIELKSKEWYRQTEIGGRYRRGFDPELGPEIDMAAAGEWGPDLKKLRDQLAEQLKKRKELGQLVKDWEISKRKLAAELQNEGVRSSANLQGRSAATQAKGDRLLRLSLDIESAQRKLEESGGYVERIKSTFEEINRKIALAKAEMSEKDLLNARVLLRSLNEELDESSSQTQEVNALDKQKLLDEALGHGSY